MRSRFAGALMYVFYLTFFVIVALLTLELISRAAVQILQGVPGKKIGLWIYDPELGARYGPHRYNSFTSLNNFGFRNREDVFDPKPSNGLRVLVFGGSTTFGRGLQDEETITFQLEKMLREVLGWEKTQVLNAGTTNFSAGQNWILMRRLIPQLKPDYVILYEGVNEIQNGWYLVKKDRVRLDKLKGRYGVIAKRYDQNDRLKMHSVFLRQADKWLKEALGYHPSPLMEQNEISSHPWIRENYRYLLEQMTDYVLQQGAKPLMVRYAWLPKVCPVQETYSDINEAVARNQGALIYDMKSDFAQYPGGSERLFLFTGVHVSPIGAERMASGLFDLILRDAGHSEKVREK